MKTKIKVLILFMSVPMIIGCAASPDQGKYESANEETENVFLFPRDKVLLIPSIGYSEYPCISSIVEEHLKKINIPTQPADFINSDTFVQDSLNGTHAFSSSQIELITKSLVLFVKLETGKKAGGSWNPNTGAITSSWKNTDVTFSLYDPSENKYVWSEKSGKRKVLDCSDKEMTNILVQAIGKIK